MRRLWLLLPVFLLAACGAHEPLDDDPTLVTLEARAARIDPTPLPPISPAAAEQSYQALARSTDNDALKAMALQRLADLELERKPAAAETDQASAQGAAKTPETREAGEDNVVKAIAQYRRLLELYPDYPGNDRVLYQLARAYEINGDLEQTLATLDRLAAAYPQAANRDEIQFRRGEILFAFRQFPQAEAAYQAVIAQGPNGAYYDRALFKHGWAVFKQGDTQRSLRSYFAVLDRSFADHDSDLASFSRSEQELIGDTLRIVSLAFSYLKGPASVATFFDDYGARDYAFQVYRRLSDLYLGQGRTDDATVTLDTFIRRHPLHPQAPQFLVAKIDILHRAGKLKTLLQAKADLATAYGMRTAFWQHNDDPALRAKLAPALKRSLDDLARYYHAQAQKSGKATDFRIAAHWYRAYVNDFPKDPKSPSMHMLLGETLLAAGDLPAAAAAFAATAYDYPPHAQSAEAGYAALLAQRQLAERAQGAARSAQRRAAIAAAKRFVTWFADDPRAITVMSKAAEELLALQDHPNAVNTAWYVVGAVPTAPLALRRIDWGIIAVGEFELGLYAEAEAASLKRLDITAADDAERPAFVERLAAAIYKQGEQARAEGLHGAAARHFLRVGELAPTASIRANALFDAAAELVTKGDYKLAIPVLKVFTSRYPTHALAPAAYEKLALSYEKGEDWQHAADTLQVLYRQAGDGERKRLLLWQSAEYYAKAGQPHAAAEAYKAYVRDFEQPFDDYVEAHARLAEIYGQRRNAPSRRYWLGKLVALGSTAQAITPRLQTLAAEASLELAESSYQAYRKVKLVAPLKQNLKQKKALMQTSVKAYTQAANFGVAAVSTAATYHLADIYQGFGQALLDSERPKGLNQEELEQYDILLEEQAYPFEEKAIEAHELNAGRAAEGVYDQWVKKSLVALGKLMPVRYDKPEKTAEVVDDIR